MYIYICIYIHTHTHMRACACTYIYVHLSLSLYIYIYRVNPSVTKPLKGRAKAEAKAEVTLLLFFGVYILSYHTTHTTKAGRRAGESHWRRRRQRLARRPEDASREKETDTYVCVFARAYARVCVCTYVCVCPRVKGALQLLSKRHM